MKKFLCFILFFSFCSTNDVGGKYIPVSCDGDGDGCEKLYTENANVGWKDENFKYCEESSLTFNFEKKFNLEMIEITNFQDDKFDRSAKPKNIFIYGPKDEDMVYGGFVLGVNLENTKDRQLITIPDDWPKLDQVLILIQEGYFTPGNVEFCGIQNINFSGSEN